MKKRIIFSILLVLFVTCLTTYGLTYNRVFYNQNRGHLGTGTPMDPLWQLIGEADDLFSLSSTNPGTGNVFYVDSGVTTEGDGTTWDNAKNTLDEAVALCAANNGDVIYVAQGHNEALIAADGVDLDVAGITVVGCGRGSNRPRFDYDNTAGEFVIGAASVTICNLTFLPSVNIVTHAIDVENAGDYATIIRCEFLDGETVGTDEFVDTVQVGTTATDFTMIGCRYYSTGTGSNNVVDLSAAAIANPTIVGCVFYGAFAEAGIWAATAVPTNVYIASCSVSNTTASQYCIEFGGAATGMIRDCETNPTTASFGLDPGSMGVFNVTDKVIGTTDLTSAPSYPLEDTLGNSLGYNDADNLFVSSTTGSNRDGSILERLEFICKYLETGTAGALVAPADTRSLLDILGSDGSTTTGALAGSLLGAIGTNEAAANTPFTSSTAESDRDGSVLERLEFLCKYFETGTPGALVAPANTMSILDIIGTDGSTTTGALAGSLLGAIGTNELSANTPFSSSTVQSDADGSALERLEYLQVISADLAGISQIGDKVVADMDANSLLVNWTAVRAAILTDLAGISQIGDKVQVDMDANSLLVNWTAGRAAIVSDLAGISEIGDKIVADMDANSLLVNWTAARAAIVTDLAGISQLGDKIVADMDANSTLVTILADTGAMDTEAEWADLSSTVVDNIVAAMDANSTLATVLADTGAMDTEAEWANLGSTLVDNVQAAMDANSTLLYWTERAATQTAVNNCVSSNLFDVAGGPILITSFVGIVTEAVDSNAATAKIIIDRDDLAADTDFTTAVAVESDALGTVYIFTNANPAVLTPLTPGGVGSTSLMMPWFCPEGMIETVFSAPNLDGQIAWYMRWKPLTTGVTVTAQ